MQIKLQKLFGTSSGEKAMQSLSEAFIIYIIVKGQSPVYLDG